jgi:hypothetical protein
MTRLRTLLIPLAAAPVLAGCSSNSAPSTAAPAATTAAAATSAAPTGVVSTPASCPGDNRLPSGACAVDPSAPAGGGLINDRTAWTVCPDALRATAADMADPDKMATLGAAAATSQDLGLATAGQLLADRTRLAKAANGTAREASTVKDMTTSATAIAAKCRDAGYKAKRRRMRSDRPTGGVTGRQ